MHTPHSVSSPDGSYGWTHKGFGGKIVIPFILLARSTLNSILPGDLPLRDVRIHFRQILPSSFSCHGDFTLENFIFLGKLTKRHEQHPLYIVSLLSYLGTYILDIHVHIFITESSLDFQLVKIWEASS